MHAVSHPNVLRFHAWYETQNHLVRVGKRLEADRQPSGARSRGNMVSC